MMNDYLDDGTERRGTRNNATYTNNHLQHLHIDLEWRRLD
jgi:hypothetical protein